MQELGPENRDLVVFSEGLPDLNRGKSLMEKYGFSPALPDKFRQLNTVLARVKPEVRRVSFELIPDEDNPIINAETEHYGGYSLKIDIIPRSDSLSGPTKARLELSLSGRLNKPSFNPTVEDLGEFIKKLTVEKEGALKGVATTGVREDVSWMDFVNHSTLTITEAENESDEVSLRLQEYEYFELHQEGQDEPVITVVLRPVFVSKLNKACMVPGLQSFVYKGTPEDVEGVMGILRDFLDKPKYYPSVDKTFTG